MLWATHLVEEAEAAHRVLVLHKGRLLADGNAKRLSYRGGARLVPADADTAMPTPEGETAEAETDAPEVAA